MKKIDNPCNVFKKFMKSEPWDYDNSGAEGVAAGEAASAGRAAASAST